MTINTVNAIQELMMQYDAKRAEWIKKFGTADGFDAWFTSQVLGK
jgi:hypothetical protein